MRKKYLKMRNRGIFVVCAYIYARAGVWVWVYAREGGGPGREEG